MDAKESLGGGDVEFGEEEGVVILDSRDANPPDFIGRLPIIHPNSRPYDFHPYPPDLKKNKKKRFFFFFFFLSPPPQYIYL